MPIIVYMTYESYYFRKVKLTLFITITVSIYIYCAGEIEREIEEVNSKKLQHEADHQEYKREVKTCKFLVR